MLRFYAEPGAESKLSDGSPAATHIRTLVYGRAWRISGSQWEGRRVRYVISEHAAEGISDRKIPLELLESTLEHPQQIVPEYKGRKCYQSQIAGSDGKIYLLRVIVMDIPDPAVVVTAYRTSKIGKYWREP